MRGWLLGIATLLVLSAAGGWGLYLAYSAPGAAILLDTRTASWIKAPEPIFLGTRQIAPQRTAFLRSLDLPAVPEQVTLRVLSFRRSLVSVNGIPVEPYATLATPWVGGETYEIASMLRQGENLVVVAVESDRGPPALLIESGFPDLRTGPGWEAHPEGGRIGGVWLLSERLSHPIQKAFPTASDGLRSVAPYLGGAFLLGVAGTLILSAWAPRPAPILTPSRMRWLLMGAWLLLCANNFVRLPLAVGFDVAGHRQYIEIIANEGRLPLATDGWQTFQSPLYHLLTAGLYRIAGLVVSEPHAIFVARLIPMLCGLALIGIAYRSGGRVFPERPDLRIVALVIAGTIPMSFYICQEIGNEPLAGALGAALLDLCLLESLAATDRPWAAWRGARLGAVFGLALLSKITLLLLLPVLAWVLWTRARVRGAPSVLAAGAGFSLALGLVSGWYFLRNWILLGHLFMDGWDPARGIPWWQDPGYRTVHDFLRFGDALVRPVWAPLSGFWDSLYATTWLDGFLSSQIVSQAAPPWNYDFMAALAPMALPLTLALLLGIVLIPATRERATRVALALLAGVGLCFLGAIAYVFLTLPIYSTVKATYGLSLVPALGLLAARGLRPLLEYRWGAAILAGYLSSWAVCVFAAFWIR